MRFPTLPFLLLALCFLALFTPGVVADNKGRCRQYSPKVFQAINRFCALKKIKVPSGYGNMGKWDATKMAKATIGGACWPMMWVPQKYCYSQFYEMCAQRKRTRMYGKWSCQLWVLQYEEDVLNAVNPH